jgi:hypothetical protein
MGFDAVGDGGWHGNHENTRVRKHEIKRHARIGSRYKNSWRRGWQGWSCLISTGW